jgi:hypothetical protein
MSETPTPPVFEPPPPKPYYKITADELGIADTLVSGQTLDLGVRKNFDGIGWGAKLTNCELRVHKPNRATVHNATLEDCRIVAARSKVEDLTWWNVRFVRCTFEGVFRLCMFGVEDPQDPSYPPTLEGCDFSKARLDYCSFFGEIDLPSTRWPASPHVIFFQPDSHRSEILSIVPEWPLQGLLQQITFRDATCRAVAISQEFLEENRRPKKDGYPGYPPAQFEQFLNKCRTLDYVRINF